jgi:hypothetical protein
MDLPGKVTVKGWRLRQSRSDATNGSALYCELDSAK